MTYSETKLLPKDTELASTIVSVLQIDPELAMAEADKVEDDEDLRKKLRLMVAKHVVKQEKGAKRENIRKAIAFLKETDGLLKIEDILPFFPDFALIDDFKVSKLILSSKHTNALSWANKVAIPLFLFCSNTVCAGSDLLVSGGLQQANRTTERGDE